MMFILFVGILPEVVDVRLVMPAGKIKGKSEFIS
jgi:hypothetical protein